MCIRDSYRLIGYANRVMADEDFRNAAAFDGTSDGGSSCED